MSTSNPLAFTTQNYTDIQGLEKIRHENKVNPNESKIQVAKQFEALFLEMVVSSMRKASSALKSENDEGDDESMSVYQDLYDKQLSQVMSQSGTGLSTLFLNYLNHNAHQSDSHAFGIAQSDAALSTSNHPVLSASTLSSANPTSHLQQTHDGISTGSFSNSAKQFIQDFWQEANLAAKQIGLDPAVLLAQAGLETHWGEKIIKHLNGSSSNNLFNIKANAQSQDAIRVQSLEQRGDTLVKEPTQFRVYANTKESFQDYIHLIKNHVRYQQALQVAAHPLQFVEALQQAGYATDLNYAKKIKAILQNPGFQNWIQSMKKGI